MKTGEEGKLFDDNGTELRGKVIDMPDLLQRLKTMSGSTTAQTALEVIERFRRLLLPVYMGVSETAMMGEPIPDEARVFTFAGSGASDFTYMAEFRALMGDERVIVAQAEADLARLESKKNAT